MNDWPPSFTVHALPAFPAIERDLSAIVDEAIRWQELCDAVQGLSLEHLKDIDFVTVYRGQGIDAGRKSITLRLRFRAEDRTLRNEEIDSVMPSVRALLTEQFNAEIRA